MLMVLKEEEFRLRHFGRRKFYTIKIYDLKQKEKGNKHIASAALSDKTNVRPRTVKNVVSREALLNMIWFNNKNHAC